MSATVDHPIASAPRPGLSRPVVVGAGLAAALIVALAAALVITLQRVNQVSDDLASTQADLAEVKADQAATAADLSRVEAGSALFAAQVQGITEQFIELQPTLEAGLDDAIDGIEEFASSTLEFTVSVDEVIDIGTDVVIQRTIEVPINTTVPINETIETTIRIATPLGFDVPVDVTVPVAIDVPIDLDIAIPIDETVPINVEVPIAVDVPVSVSVAETELAPLAQSLANGLRQLQTILEELTGTS